MFLLAAILIGIFALDLVWWHSILLCLLAAFHITITTSDGRRRKTYRI